MIGDVPRAILPARDATGQTMSDDTVGSPATDALPRMRLAPARFSPGRPSGLARRSASERRAAQGLALALAALATVAGLGLALRLSGSGLGIGASYAWFRTTEASYDSWGPMITAFHYLRNGEGGLYDVFFVAHVKFQYPPASLSLIWLLDALGITARDAQLRALNLATWCSVLLTVPFVFGIAWNVGRPRLGESPRATRMRTAACLAIAALTLVFWPVMLSWTIGQIQTTLNLLFVASLYAWTCGRRGLAGACIGLICLFKPQFLLFLPWALLVDRRFLVGQLLTCVPILGVSLLVFGPETHLAYLKVLSFLSAHGESYVLNQSVNGVLNRLVHPETAWVDRGRVWLEGSDFPPYDRVVHLASTATTLAATAAAFWLAWRRGGTVSTFCFAALAMTLASPIAWDHHYGILIGVYAAAFGLLSATLARGRRPGGLEAAFLLCGAMVGIRMMPRLPDHPWLENLLLSHLFAGALVMLWLTWRLTEVEAARRP